MALIRTKAAITVSQTHTHTHTHTYTHRPDESDCLKQPILDKRSQSKATEIRIVASCISFQDKASEASPLSILAVIVIITSRLFNALRVRVLRYHKREVGFDQRFEESDFCKAFKCTYIYMCAHRRRCETIDC